MTQRIVLSPATIDEVELIVAGKTDASLWPYEEEHEFADLDSIRKDVVERVSSDWYKQYIIKLNNLHSTPVGLLHMHWYVKERKSWEIGYCVYPEYRRQGYCLEAAGIALKYAFEEWGAHKVVGMCNEHNIGSIRTMERLGMVREGVFREELLWRNKWVHQLFYCILEGEYREGTVL